MKAIFKAALVAGALALLPAAAFADHVGIHVGPMGVGIHVGHHHHRYCTWHHHHRDCYWR